MTIHYCKECKHAQPRLVCGHPTSLVDGKSTACAYVRDGWAGSCGAEGKHFEPIREDPERRSMRAALLRIRELSHDAVVRALNGESVDLGVELSRLESIAAKELAA